MRQQLFAARSQIAKLQEDIYNLCTNFEQILRQRRTGKIRVYTKGLLQDASFMYKAGEQTSDIVYEDNKYIKLEQPGLELSYRIYEKYHGDIY